jgi:hypothetical protein
VQTVVDVAVKSAIQQGELAAPAVVTAVVAGATSGQAYAAALEAQSTAGAGTAVTTEAFGSARIAATRIHMLAFAPADATPA